MYTGYARQSEEVTSDLLTLVLEKEKQVFPYFTLSERNQIFQEPVSKNHLNGHYINFQDVNAGITTNTNESSANKSWSTLGGLDDRLLKSIAQVNC